MRLLRILMLVAVFGLIAGCDEKSENVAPGERPRLVSKQEIQAIEKRLLAEVAEIKAKKCPRPVLRGEPLAGSAGADIVALVEGADELAKCQKEYDEDTVQIKESLFYPEGQEPAGIPSRNSLTARNWSDPNPLQLRLAVVCEPVIKRIQQAVRHVDACSPYRPGLRGQPKLIWMIHAVRFTAYWAHNALDKGMAARGFDLLLDSLRFCQDFSRGGTSVLEAMVAVGALRSVLPVIEKGLNQAKPLDDGLLARIERELGVLIETQPHPESFLRGESQSMCLYGLMPGLKGPDWNPPGGWGTDGRPDHNFTTVEFGLDDAEGNALAIIAIQETGQAWLAGCKPETQPIDCYGHMVKLGQELKETADPNPDSIAGILKVAFAEDKAKEVRRQIIQILKSIASPAFDKYVAKEGQVRFSLAALRLQAAYRRLAEKKKTCPDVAVFDQPPLSKLRTDPYSGKKIKIESIGPGRLVLRSPVALGKQGGDDREPAVFIRCPYGK